MIKLLAKTSTSTESVEIPQSWDELSTDMFQRIATEWDCKDAIKLFSIASGIDYDGIRDSKDRTLETKLIAAIQFIYKSPIEWDNIKSPETLEINGKSIVIPKNIAALTIGQSIVLKQRIQEYANEFKHRKDVPVFIKDFYFDGLISYAIAIYLQPIVYDCPFDTLKAYELEREILKMPITKTYPIGFFLLARLMGFGRHSITNWIVSKKETILMMRPLRWLRWKS